MERDKNTGTTDSQRHQENTKNIRRENSAPPCLCGEKNARSIPRIF